METRLETLMESLQRAKTEIQKVIIGHDRVIDCALIAIFTQQHVLLEGYPGIAKTLLVKTLAHVLGCDFSRIQFTPDLMPSDIIGTSVFNLQRNEFTVMQGPVFTTFLLADEINRAPAKTQSALLQAMAERQVSIDRTTHTLSPLFTVFATQNPIESEGTYPLPEAQKDRFMFKLNLEYPTREEEILLAQRTLGDNSPEKVLSSGEVKPVITHEMIHEFQQGLSLVQMRQELIDYGVDLVRASREHPATLVGGGPRATQSLLLASRVHAALQGRDFVTPDDLRTMFTPVLEHRLLLRPEFEIEGTDSRLVLDQLLEKVEVPR